MEKERTREREKERKTEREREREGGGEREGGRESWEELGQPIPVLGRPAQPELVIFAAPARKAES